MQSRPEWVLRNVCQKIGYVLGIQNFDISYKVIGQGTFAEGKFSFRNIIF